MKTNNEIMTSFLQQGRQFFENLNVELKTLGFETAELPCDHLCFRVATNQEYQDYRHLLQQEAVLLTEAMVNGRSICTFRLKQPLQTPTHKIELIELPSPKANAPYITGFEHAEFVISESFEFFRKKYPGRDFEVSGRKILNPELCLKLSLGQVKFHHHSLERIIQIEEGKIRHVVFDFDGTLVDSRLQIYEINRKVFTEVLQREVSLAESIEKFHSDFKSLFQSFEIFGNNEQKLAIQKWSLYASEFQYELFKDVVLMLNELKSAGFRLHLWTARDEFSARNIINDLKISALFETCSFATAATSKPDPATLAFDWRAASLEGILMIGDSPSDVRAAKNVKAVSAVALWDTSCNKESLVESGAELFFSRPEELTSWLSPATMANAH